MPDNSDDVGGRLFKDAAQRSRGNDANWTRAPESGSAGALGLGGAMRSADLLVQARHLEQTANLLASTRLPFGLDNDEQVVHEAQQLLHLLDERHRPLDVIEAPAIEFAMFAVARFSSSAEGSAAPVLRALATGIAARARGLGVKLSPDLPGSDVVAASAQPAAHIGTVIVAIDALVGEARERLAAASAPDSKASVVAAVAPRIAAMLREGARAADGDSQLSQSDHVSKSLELLAADARVKQLDLVATGLDEVFDAEDGLHIALGATPKNRRGEFYGNRNESDFDGDRDHDPTKPDGSQIIDQILAWYEYEPVRTHLGLTSLSAIINEPPRVRDDSLFERLLASAVQFALGALSSHLTDVFATAVKALSADPSMLTGAAHEVGATVGAAAGALPGPVKRGAMAVGRAGARVARPLTEALDLGAVEQRALVELLHAGQAVLRPIGAQLEVGKKIEKTILAGVGGEAKPASRGLLSTAFIDTLTAEVDLYMNAVISRGPALRRALELVPPAGLQQMLGGLMAGTATAATALRGDLVARWASVVSGASSGEDPDGTSAHGGTLEQAAEQPGVLQLDVTVRKPRQDMVGTRTPVVQLDRIELNGMSESGLDALRAVKRPFSAVAMQRVVKVSFLDGYSGVQLSAGRFDVGPDGQFDLGGVELMDLAALSRGDVPDHSHTDLERAIVGGAGAASNDDATRGAHFILAQLRATTADIP